MLSRVGCSTPAGLGMNACFSPSVSFRHSLQKARPESRHRTSTESFSHPAPNRTDAFICPVSFCPRVQTVRLVRVSGHAMIGNDETPGSGILADSSHSLRRRARSLTLVGFVDHWLEARAKPNTHKEKNRIFHAQCKDRYRIVAREHQKGVVGRLNGLLLDPEHSRYVLEPNVSRQQLADSSSLGADSMQLLKVTLGLHTAEAGRS